MVSAVARGRYNSIKHHIARSEMLAKSKMRFSKKLERTYMSNGYAHCDALFASISTVDVENSRSSVSQFVAGVGQPDLHLRN